MGTAKLPTWSGCRHFLGIPPLTYKKKKKKKKKKRHKALPGNKTGFRYIRRRLTWQVRAICSLIAKGGNSVQNGVLI
jgi:hypothetical protein